MGESQFDRIHDGFLDPDATRKPGVKYERLAAVVAKCLGPEVIVRHDQHYFGKADLSTQIDVTIDRGDGPLRTLLECKDFDISGKRVGVAKVREFFGVWKDLGADDAWIVTCNNFTSGARKWAKAHGIKLAILREFRESDWEGHFRELGIDWTIPSLAGQARTSLVLHSGEDQTKLLKVLGGSSDQFTNREPELIERNGRIRRFGELMKELPFASQDVGPQHFEFDLSGARLRNTLTGDEVLIEKIEMDYAVVRYEFKTVVKMPAIAMLLAQGFGPGDMVIWDTTLHRFDIDSETGIVSERVQNG